MIKNKAQVFDKIKKDYKNENLEIPEVRKNNFNIIRYFSLLAVIYGHQFAILQIMI